MTVHLTKETEKETKTSCLIRKETNFIKESSINDEKILKDTVNKECVRDREGE